MKFGTFREHYLRRCESDGMSRYELTIRAIVQLGLLDDITHEQMEIVYRDEKRRQTNPTMDFRDDRRPPWEQQNSKFGGLKR